MGNVCILLPKEEKIFKGFALKIDDLWLPFGLSDVTEEHYLYIVLQHKQLHGIWLGYFSLFGDGNHMPVCVLPLLLGCCFLHLSTCLLECSQGDLLFYPLISHLSAAVLVRKSRYVPVGGFNNRISHAALAYFFQSQRQLVEWEASWGTTGENKPGWHIQRQGRVPGQPLLGIKCCLLRPEGLFFREIQCWTGLI